MKVVCLSEDSARPCLLLQYHGAKIMLDCALDVKALQSFMPIPLLPDRRLESLPGWAPKVSNGETIGAEFKECCGRVFVDGEPEFGVPMIDGVVPPSEIDAILISNFMCILALPFITEGTGFAGTIYATEPTLQIGRLFMEEILEYLEGCPKENQGSLWKKFIHLLPPKLAALGTTPLNWQTIYSKEKLNSCLERVQAVGYNEKLDVFGALKVSAVSSGFCIGSCNWIISSFKERIVYMSGSSTLTTHPMSCDQSGLKNADVLILTGLSQTPAVNPDAMLGEFCQSVASTLKAGGNVLVPCYPSGVIYDLFECVSGHLDNSGLSSIPLYFISPVADSSLAYSNIFAEWLSHGKQSKVYVPEEPFPHANLVRENRLKSFRYVHDEKLNSDYREPCIVFCGHPSLRFGAAVHFTLLWGYNPLNTIVMIEPDFDPVEVLAPYQPLAAKVTMCPIDTTINFQQGNILIRDLKPAKLVVPHGYTVTPPGLPHRTDLKLDLSSVTSVTTFRPLEVIKIPMERTVERIEVDLELARALLPVELRPGLKLALIPLAELHRRDNKYTLKSSAITQISDSPASPEEEIDDAREPAKKRKKNTNDINKCPPTPAEIAAFMPWGKLDVTGFVKQLHEVFAAQNVKTDDFDNGEKIITINFNNDEGMIQLGEGRTHIICSDETLRRKLSKLVQEKLLLQV